jgi:antitoxin component YwqK of YwqJK toxin-antitoxin module
MSAGSPFYENGLPRFKGDFQNGKMHGFWQFFRKDGSLMRSGHFDEDRQVGAWTTYARDGSVVKETDYRS